MDWSGEFIASLISCVVSAVGGGALTYVWTKWKRNLKRERALEAGVRSLLRNNLIHYHDKYTARGCCPIYVKESARISYEAYHELGGNGVITKLYEDIMALPEEQGPCGKA